MRGGGARQRDSGGGRSSNAAEQRGERSSRGARGRHDDGAPQSQQGTMTASPTAGASIDSKVNTNDPNARVECSTRACQQPRDSTAQSVERIANESQDTRHGFDVLSSVHRVPPFLNCLCMHASACVLLLPLTQQLLELRKTDLVRTRQLSRQCRCLSLSRVATHTVQCQVQFR